MHNNALVKVKKYKGKTVNPATQAFIKVIGIGSPFGDDYVASQIVSHLAKKNTLKPYIGSCLSLQYDDRPGIRLLEMINTEMTLILIDAVVSGQETGKIIQLRNHDIECFHSTLSSHGIAIAESLAIGRALNQLPESILFYGVEINPDAVSSQVRNAVPVLVKIIENKVIELLCSTK